MLVVAQLVFAYRDNLRGIAEDGLEGVQMMYYRVATRDRRGGPASSQGASRPAAAAAADGLSLAGGQEESETSPLQPPGQQRSDQPPQP